MLGKFFVLIGPAGAGKSSIASALLDSHKGELHKSLSATTRNPRPNEVHGKDYHFMTREQFEKDVSAGLFFEWEETHGNLYGTPQAQIDLVLQSKGGLLLDVDVRGAETFKSKFGEKVVVVLILPPTADALVSRMEGRGGLKSGELETRLETAKREFADFNEGLHQGTIEYVVLNSSLDTSIREVSCIFQGEFKEARESVVQKGLDLLNKLSEEIESRLQ